MFHIASPDHARAFARFGVEDGPRYRGVFGHMPFGVDRLTDRPVSYVTFLRHPVERALSAYAHNLRYPHEPGAQEIRAMGLAWTMQPSNFVCLFLSNYDLLQQPSPKGRFWWLDSPPDFVSRAHLEQAKANLEQCAFIGLTEHFESDVRELANLPGFDIRVPEVMPTKKTGPNRIRQSELIEEEVQAILAANRLDMELYEYALELRRRWGGPIRTDRLHVAGPSVVAAGLQHASEPRPLVKPRAQELSWTEADLQWRTLPDHQLSGPLPETFTTPSNSFDYAAATGLLKAAHCFVRLRVKVTAGSVGIFLAPPDGIEHLSEETVLTPLDGAVFVHFRMTPAKAPAILVVRSHEVQGASGSIEISAAHYAACDAQAADELEAADAPADVEDEENEARTG